MPPRPTPTSSAPPTARPPSGPVPSTISGASANPSASVAHGKRLRSKPGHPPNLTFSPATIGKRFRSRTPRPSPSASASRSISPATANGSRTAVSKSPPAKRPPTTSLPLIKPTGSAPLPNPPPPPPPSSPTIRPPEFVFIRDHSRLKISPVSLFPFPT